MRSAITRLSRRTWVAIGIVAAVVLVIAVGYGISSRNTFDNRGGDTTCGEFKQLKAEERKQTIIKLLGDRGQETKDINVTVALASSIMYCQTVAEDTDQIKKMYSGKASASATP